MLDLELAVPIYLDRQLKKISDQADISFKLIKQMAYHTSPACLIVTENNGSFKKYDILELNESWTKDDGETYTRVRTDIPADCFYAGYQAIEWLCGEKKINVEPLYKIAIPTRVYYESNRDQWNDISSQFAEVCSRNERVGRLATLGAPLLIIINEARLLWEKVEFLETAHIDGINRKWNHGRIVRGLNDIGFSLTDGWAESMKEPAEVIDEEERKERLREYREKEISWYTARFVKQGMEPGEALLKAFRKVNGELDTRVCTVEGKGMYIDSVKRKSVVYEFLDKHRRSFVRSEIEEKIMERLQDETLDLDEVFEDTNYELDPPGYAFEHWAVAVANVMIRETGLGFDVHVRDREDQRSCIIFPDKSPWLYNEKEKKLSSNMLYQILDRYALELQLTVTRNCFFVTTAEDIDE